MIPRQRPQSAARPATSAGAPAARNRRGSAPSCLGAVRSASPRPLRLQQCSTSEPPEDHTRGRTPAGSAPWSRTSLRRTPPPAALCLRGEGGSSPPAASCLHQAKARSGMLPQQLGPAARWQPAQAVALVPALVTPPGAATQLAEATSACQRRPAAPGCRTLETGFASLVGSWCAAPAAAEGPVGTMAAVAAVPWPPLAVAVEAPLPFWKFWAVAASMKRTLRMAVLDENALRPEAVAVPEPRHPASVVVAAATGAP